MGRKIIKIDYDKVKQILMDTHFRPNKSTVEYRDKVLKELEVLAGEEPRPPYQIIFAFEDKEDMEDFVYRNKKLFHPWSENIVNTIALSEEMADHMRLGYYYDYETYGYHLGAPCYYQGLAVQYTPGINSYEERSKLWDYQINGKTIGIDIHLVHVLMSYSYLPMIKMPGTFEKGTVYKDGKKYSYSYRNVRVYKKEA